jgi:catechol 2,3-dioxygenase-like lactoylglutathione lyase family enzyme
MLISKVELPVSDAAQAARFYGDVLGLPIRTGGGVVEVAVGLSVMLLDPGRWSRARTTAPLPSPKTALLRPRPGCRSGFHCWSGTVWTSSRWGRRGLPVGLLRRAG